MQSALRLLQGACIVIMVPTSAQYLLSTQQTSFLNLGHTNIHYYSQVRSGPKPIKIRKSLSRVVWVGVRALQDA